MMSKTCYIVFDNGYLTCITNHRNYKNCDLTPATKKGTKK